MGKVILIAVVVGVLAAVGVANAKPNDCIGPVKDKLLSIAPSPSEIKAFLHKTVKLTSTSEFFGDKGFLDKPVDWEAYLGQSEKCMAKNEYFMKFACQVYKNPEPYKFSSVGDELLKEAMMLSVFLDRGTAWLVTHPRSIGHVLSTLKRRRKENKCTTVLGHSPKGLFARAKIWAVDFALGGDAASLTDGSDVSTAGGWKVALNIYEAVILDLVKKRTANAKTGSILAAYTAGSKTENPVTGEGPSKWVGHPPKLSYRYPLGALWADLYQSWNLAFCYGTYKSYPLFFAKLLIPSVSCYQDYDGQFYLWNRGIALMLYMNWACLIAKERGSISSEWPMAKSVVISEKVIKAWGGNNKAAALGYRQTMRKLDPPIYRAVEKQLREEWRSAKRKARHLKSSSVNAVRKVAQSLARLKQRFTGRESDGRLQPDKGDKTSTENAKTTTPSNSGKTKTSKPTFSQRVRSLFGK